MVVVAPLSKFTEKKKTSLNHMHHMGAFYGMFGQKNKFSVHGRLSSFCF